MQKILGILGKVKLVRKKGSEILGEIESSLKEDLFRKVVKKVELVWKKNLYAVSVVKVLMV